MGGISFPLKWKIISSNILLLIATVFLLVHFASELFNEDKSATLYEAVLSAGNSYQEQVRSVLEENSVSFELLQEINERNTKTPDSDLLKKIFKKNKHLISFTVFKKENLGLHIYLENDLYQGQNNLEDKHWLNIDQTHYKEGALKDYLRVKKGEKPFYKKVVVTDNFYYIGRFEFRGIFGESSLSNHFNSFLVTNETVLGNTQALEKFKGVGSLDNLFDPWKSDWQRGNSNKVIRKELNGSGFLTYGAVLSPNFSVLTIVDEGLIYQASSFLRDQSLYFSLLILGLTILMGVFLSRRMTKGLMSLHDASLAYAQGEFDADLKINSRDEIGSLAKTFKNMGREILNYVEEMKDKARLEKEVEVAKLVQESFIPGEHKQLGEYGLYTLYESASECGGDWWGVIERGHYITLVVADATGHGVPAALMTATASGTLNNIEYRLKESNQDFFDPKIILENLNYSIAKMESTIHMTAFALVLNKETGLCLYSNASHNPPLLVRKGLEGNSLSKENIEPLMGNTCPRLGQSIDSDFISSEIQLNGNDALILFSDGIIEEENSEGKEYGQRRFIKSILNHLNETSGEIHNLSYAILKDLKTFTNKNQWSDDLTFLTIGKSREVLKKYEVSGNTLITKGATNEEVYGVLLSQYGFKNVISDGDSIRLKQILTPETINHSNVFTRDFSSISEADSFFDEAFSEIETQGYFNSPIEILKLVAREMISNAVFHHKEETSHSSRKESVVSDKSATFTLAQGESGISVFVKDSYGRLNFERFKEALVRAYQSKLPEQKEGGAGLGLMMLFENSNEVIIEEQSGVSLTVCAIIEKEKRYKNFKSKTTKFAYWENKGE